MAGGLRLTFAEFKSEVNNVAHGLADAGWGRATAWRSCSANSLEFLLASYALKKLGAVEVAINTGFRGPGLAHVVNTEARLMITEDEFVAARAGSSELEHLRTVVLVDGRGKRRAPAAGSTSGTPRLISEPATTPARRAQRPGDRAVHVRHHRAVEGVHAASSLRRA